MDEDVEIVGFELVFHKIKQQRILEHAAREGNGGQMGRFTEALACVGEKLCKVCVKSVSETSGRVIRLTFEMGQAALREARKEGLRGNMEEGVGRSLLCRRKWETICEGDCFF